MLTDDKLPDQQYLPFQHVENLFNEISEMELFNKGKLDDHEKELVDILVEVWKTWICYYWILKYQIFQKSKKFTCNISTLENLINNWIQKHAEKQLLQFAMMAAML